MRNITFDAVPRKAAKKAPPKPKPAKPATPTALVNPPTIDDKMMTSPMQAVPMQVMPVNVAEQAKQQAEPEAPKAVNKKLPGKHSLFESEQTFSGN